jgi:hypothetical protein
MAESRVDGGIYGAGTREACDCIPRLAGFNPSTINHELYHCTDDVTRLAGFNPSNNMNPNNTRIVKSCPKASIVPLAGKVKLSQIKS